MWTIFKVFIEFVAIFMSFYLAPRHVGSLTKLSDQGSNLYPLHWKVKS